jgi:hypothetical protein
VLSFFPLSLLRRSTAVLPVAAILLGAPSVPHGQQPAEAPDVQALGPQIGTQVPDFALPDQNGDIRTLESLMGPEGLMLVFARSADW